MKLQLAHLVRRFLAFLVRHASADSELYLERAGIDVEGLRDREPITPVFNPRFVWEDDITPPGPSARP